MANQRDSLVEFLREWRVADMGRSAARYTPEPKRLQEAAAEVVRRLGDRSPRVPEPFELQRIETEFRRAWSELRSISRVSVRSLRLAPWVLFSPRGAPDRWLGRDPRFVDAWLAWLREHGRPRTIVALLHEFFAVYPETLPTFEPLRTTLQELLRRGDSPRVARWKERCSKFNLLSPRTPVVLTNQWWDDTRSFQEYGTELGLVPGLESCALLRRATEELLGGVAMVLSRPKPSPPFLARAIVWLEADDRLRFPELRVRVASALLSPFAERVPEPGVQQLVQSFLLRAIGDPRSQRPRWQGVPADIRNILLRWLVAGSLEDFFRVLDETADEQWRFRKAFWSAYLKREVIADAWVVLGSAASRVVKKEFSGPMNAGRLRSGGGALGNHSVLLMRIGSLVIAEWSHNGKCRIWKPGNKKVPKLYEGEYGRSDLVQGCDWEQVHMGASDGRWQSQVAQYIRDETGIAVARAEFMPGRAR